MADPKTNPNAQLLEELEALSESLYKSHTASRRTASLVLPRTSAPSAEDDTLKVGDGISNKPRARRMSLSPWRSRPKPDDGIARGESKRIDETSTSSGDSDKKGGIWKWKPMRALSRIGMQKLSCLFSVEVVTAQGLPSSMNGLRLSVCVRKKETKDGAVKTMPSRVAQGAADFEETLFIRCHAYYSTSSTNHASGKQKQVKFEPRPFWIYLFAVDAKELEFGRSSMDLSELIRESIEKNQQGTRVRQWDISFGLSGKAKGGELVLKLGFQIMEKDGGVEIYNQAENSNSNAKSSKLSSFVRKQSKTSFSMSSPRITAKKDAWNPSQPGISDDIQGMDDLNLDDPNPNQASSTQKPPEECKDQVEDFDLPDFEVVDKGVEVQQKEEEEPESESEEAAQAKTASTEVVKEVVHDHLHLTRLSELDSIAQQIKALESMMGEDDKFMKIEEETESQRLDADEETVTREFLQMLEDQEYSAYLFDQPEIPPLQLEGQEDSSADGESKVYLPDLGKGLGSVVQTKDGGYLASMNPLNIAVDRKDTPKLAMQISKPFVLESHSHQSMSGFELFQKLAGIGFDELSSQVLSLMPIDELIGKTAEQIAFEGIASAIIQGRNKEGASSSAARIVSGLKSMSSVMSSGRRERISTGLWNVDEEPLTAEKLLAFTMQKIESMTVEALKIQADMAEDEPPFDVSALSSRKGDNGKDILASAISLEDWIREQSVTSSDSEAEKITLLLVVQLRDPVRRYEAVGGPVIVLIHATSADTEEEKRFKVTSMHVGGFKVKSGVKKNSWDSEKQKLTAKQWLVAYGLGKGGKKGKQPLPKGQVDLILWSISSRIVADMWLKTMRNPDVKLVK